MFEEIRIGLSVNHFRAIEKVHEKYARRGKNFEFYSYCGGLLAHNCNDDATEYKLSWSPRGFVISQRFFAQFLQNGKGDHIFQLTMIQPPEVDHEGRQFTINKRHDCCAGQNYLISRGTR